MKLVPACVLPLLAALVAPAAVAAEGDGSGCLVAREWSQGGLDFPEGLRAVAPATSEQRARVLFACRAGRVSGVTIRLLPGQVAEVELILAGVADHAAALVSQDGLPPEWSRVDSRRLDSGSILVTLRVAAPDSARSGRVFSDHLSLGSSRSSPAVPVTVEIIESGSLFRDEFDVDPVIGQFSMHHDADQASFPSLSEFAAD